MGCRVSAFILMLVVGIASPARAQETGSISGVVFDQGGAVVADAAVTVLGRPSAGHPRDDIGGGREYRFPLLLPGTYVVAVEKAGVGTTRRTVVVEVAKDTQADVVLGLNVQEDITVTAATPDVDLKSTEVNFNYSMEEIQNLPLNRNYSGLFQLIPGVAENASFAPNGGGSRQDNTYLVDGVNITNPGFGYLSTEINGLDVVEFNVKRGAITAEFGRASGFVTNAVTRSGTNQLHGGVRFEAVPKEFTAESKDATLKNTRDEYVTSLSGGGPIVKDRLFWYASGRFQRTTDTDRVNRVGAVPDRELSVNEGFGKVTYAPSQKHFFTGSYRHRPREERFASIGTFDAPEVATNNEGTNRVATAVWNWFAGPRTTVDVKYLHMDEESESVPVTELAPRGTFDVNNLIAMGQFTDPLGFVRGGNQLLLNRQNYKRDEIKATLTQFLDFKGTSHQLKAGFGFDEGSEDLTRVSNGWGAVTVVQVKHPGTVALLPRSAVAAFAGTHLEPVRAGRHHHRPAPDDQRRPAAQQGRVHPGAGVEQHVPHLRLRRRDPAARRRELQPEQGSRRQGLRELRPVLQHGPEEQQPLAGAEPAVHEPGALQPHDRRRDQRRAGVEHHRQGPARHGSDVHGRDRCGIRHAALHGLEPRRVLSVP